MITLLQYFPYYAGAGGSGGDMFTPWIPYPEQLGDCEMHIVCHVHNTGSCDVQLQGSVNGVDPESLGAPVNVASVSTAINARDVTGSMVRLSLGTNDPTVMTISVYLVPKMS